MMCEKVMKWSWSSWRSPKDSKILHHLILTKNIVHPSSSNKNNALQGNPTCPERTSSSIHTTLLGLDWDSDDKSCRLFEHEVLEEAWRMGDDILAVNGQAIKCWVQQNVGSCVMWNPRVYPFIHCKGSTEETQRIMAFTNPHRNTKDSGVVSWGCTLYPESFNAW